MNNFKPTKAELVMWNIFLVAVCAGLTGGAPALLQYLAGTNIDPALCLKLATAGALGSFVASISTSFRKDGSNIQNLLQAALDLLNQVHDAVTVQTVQTPPTPPARVVEPQPIVLTPQPTNQGTLPVQMPIVQPSGAVVQQPLYVPNLNATATATAPTLPAWQTDIHFGDSLTNIPAVKP